MAVELISIAELDDGLEQAWLRLQAADPDLKSPFFTPAFCRIVAGLRDDVEIAVISDSAGPIGFFPFHRQRFGRLAPLAGQISDYHGVIGLRGAVSDMREVLRGARAQAYDFNHAPASQPAFAAHAFLETDSPLVDLSAGFEAWRSAQRAKVRAIRDVERRARKLGREVGELRFVANDRSEQVWQAMLDWKRAALKAMGVGFILDTPWARAVVETIRDTDSPGFAGTTSALWAGDELAAVHFGMRSGTTWHWWFPVYNESLSRYSPGLALLMESLKHAEATGLTEMDFGRGGERYKREFANASRGLCEGSVERGLSPLGAARRLRKAVQIPLGRSQSGGLSDFTRKVGNRLLFAGRIS